MSSAYERAVAFTDQLLEQRREAPFAVALGPVSVTVTPEPELAEGVNLPLTGDGLKTMRCALQVGSGSESLQTVIYISAGPKANRVDFAGEATSHYLYLHDVARNKAFHLNVQPFVSDAEAPGLLSAEIRFPLTGGSAAAERLREWLPDGRGSVRAGRRSKPTR